MILFPYKNNINYKLLNIAFINASFASSNKRTLTLYMSYLFVISIVNQFVRVVLNKSEIFINGQSVPQLNSFE
jgi:hypothetical protein